MFVRVCTNLNLELHGRDTTLFYPLIHPHFVPICPASPYSLSALTHEDTGCSITCLSCGAATPVQVVQDHVEEFLEKINFKVLAPQLKALELIPESVECDILQSKSKEEANPYLLNHLKEDADEESVREVFRIASEKTGYGKMKAFAAGVLRELQ